jgi:hypothetical protein
VKIIIFIAIFVLIYRYFSETKRAITVVLDEADITIDSMKEALANIRTKIDAVKDYSAEFESMDLQGMMEEIKEK